MKPATTNPRLPLIGGEGPVALVTGRVAYRLAQLLNRELARAQANGEYVEPDVAATIAAIDVAARNYAGRVAAAAHAAQKAAPTTPVGAASDLSTAEVAARLGCSERNVRALAERGALPARRSGRQWLFDVTDVDELIAARAAG